LTIKRKRLYWTHKTHDKYTNIRKIKNEGVFKYGQSIDTGNIGHKTQNEDKQSQNKINVDEFSK